MEKIKSNVEKAFYAYHKIALMTPISSKIEGEVITLKMMSIGDQVLTKRLLLSVRSEARFSDAYISFGSYFLQSMRACRCTEIAVVNKRGKVFIIDPILNKPMKSFDDFGDEVWTFKNPLHDE